MIINNSSSDLVRISKGWNKSVPTYACIDIWIWPIDTHEEAFQLCKAAPSTLVELGCDPKKPQSTFWEVRFYVAFHHSSIVAIGPKHDMRVVLEYLKRELVLLKEQKITFSHLSPIKPLLS